MNQRKISENKNQYANTVQFTSTTYNSSLRVYLGHNIELNLLEATDTLLNPGQHESSAGSVTTIG